MGVDVIVGGQGGDEGKGKISAYLSLKNDYDICMRVPAPQAGHSIHCDGKRVGLALLPCGLVNENSRLLIGAGGLVNYDKLFSEINSVNTNFPSKLHITPSRLGIDYRVTMVLPRHIEEEKSNRNLAERIGSVKRGVGPCRRDKLMREPGVVLARQVSSWQHYLVDSKKEIYAALEAKKNIILEGDHGAKLDLIHGEFPFVTSRPVNASAVCGEAGIGPRDVTDNYVVLKPYTTRVGPGPLEEEIFDEHALDWAHGIGGETGTESKRNRRLGKFEWDNVLEVMKMNSCTKIVITHMDCFKEIGKAIGYDDEGKFIDDIKKKLCDRAPYPGISLLSYGPREEDVVKFGSKSIRINFSSSRIDRE